jgi:hypothetical protein
VTKHQEGKVQKGLLDEIMALNNGRPGTVCGINKLYEALPAEDTEALKQAIADPMVKATAIARALKGRGYQITDSVVTRHRRKECVCES